MINEVRTYQDSWVKCTIAIIAKVAKCDGSVSPTEIALAEEMFTAMGVGPEQRSEAIRIFNHAKNSPTSLFHTAVGIRDVCKPDRETITILALSAFRMAHVDGNLSSQGKDALLTICDVFHLSYDACHKLYEGNEEYRRSEKEVYGIIGCKPSDSDETIKERYRELVKGYHPDKIASKELAPDFLKFAEDKFKKVQAAYETIMSHRHSS